ncbi:AMP-binding protein [Actomonas aquatica]|uniref:AMP-binding protein n=1 Tax=Actomonas aquatica TaxID=2866162 RepID=A0ABZ1CB53_9BACT|nr:AMP-binding protein [Opitutus sp. WL0086]WRQ88610.1 AMP-binding protein [Opitutus sp. WL0086]
MERREFLNALVRSGVNVAEGEPGRQELVVVCERDPVAFRAAFAQAVAQGGRVALANPDWGTQERAEFDRLLALRDHAGALADAETGWLLIPTGGSSGGVKLARHDQHTLAAAVQGYASFFEERVVNGVGVLPLHHVGGLMGWLRCVLTGGDYVDGSWRAWSEGRFVERVPEAATVSLVPTQLRRMLGQAEGVAWLRQFKRILIGGAATEADLVSAAQDAGLPIVLSFGMTETGALAAAVPEFAGGELEKGYAVLPHLKMDVVGEGRLRISGASLFRGYWPDWRDDDAWENGDRARRSVDGRVQLLGRVDDLIISGGEKVDGHEVETVLRELAGDPRIVVIGLPDAEWGHRVVACVGSEELVTRLEEVAGAVRERLASFKRPKLVVPVVPWPVNAMGKINRAALTAAAAAWKR